MPVPYLHKSHESNEKINAIDTLLSITEEEVHGQIVS